MRIVVTAMGKDVSSNIDPRFGRAKNFIFIDMETNESTVYDNIQNLNSAQGAGIQSAEMIARLGAEALITGNVGPKAFRALNAAGIKIYLSAGGTVADVISQYKTNQLKEISAANVEGHW